jgi:hypothetical protein
MRLSRQRGWDRTCHDQAEPKNLVLSEAAILPVGGRDAPPSNRDFREQCTNPIPFQHKAQIASRYSLQSQTLVLRPTRLRWMQRHTLHSLLLPPCQGGLHDALGDGSAATGRVSPQVRHAAGPIRYIAKAGRVLASIIPPAPQSTPVDVKASQPRNLPAGMVRAKQDSAAPSAASASTTGRMRTLESHGF